MFGLKNDEILTCFLLIIVGYILAKMFSRSCNGFSVGGQIIDEDTCKRELDSLCDKITDHSNCIICAGENQKELKNAKCTQTIISKYCNKINLNIEVKNIEQFGKKIYYYFKELFDIFKEKKIYNKKDDIKNVINYISYKIIGSENSELIEFTKYEFKDNILVLYNKNSTKLIQISMNYISHPLNLHFLYRDYNNNNNLIFIYFDNIQKSYKISNYSIDNPNTTNIIFNYILN